MRDPGYYFDEAAANRAVIFIDRLQHTKGIWAGVPFALRKWQKKIIREVFGWKNPDGTRRYRTVYIEIPRKNGKSELAAAVALYLLFSDREQGAEIYGAARDRDQASIVFNVAADMVRRSPRLRRRSKIIDSSKRIIVPKTGNLYRAIPADAAGSHGFNAHGIIFDELHVQPNRELYDALMTSTGAREQPLTFMITTAGYDRESICWEIHEYAQRILAGTIEDPTFYAVIYAAPEESDWQNRKVWRACNPALGDFLRTEHLVEEERKAREMPAFQNSFRRLHLNQWTQQQSRWIDLDLWDANAGPLVDEDKLRGRACYGGLDLGSVSDLTAWLMVFPREEDPEEIDLLARFWCPEARLKDTANRYRDAYQVWARQGWLKTTPGEATEYAFIKAQIIKDAATFRLVDMNVDRLFQAHQLCSELMEEGLKVAAFGMGFLSMAAPMQELMHRLLGRKIHHGGNPVLRWMADNVAVKQDPAGNLKPDKAESQGKIDGIVALVMGLDRAMRHEERALTWTVV
jgi:phage terminase large subunit-like protein